MKKQTDGVAARVLPHLTLVLAALLLVLFVLDRFNSNMGFLTHEITRWLVGGLSVLSIATALVLITRQWRDDRWNEAQRALAAKRAERGAERSAKAEQRAAEALRKSNVSAWQTAPPSDAHTQPPAPDAP